MDSNKDTAEKMDSNAQSDSQEVLINKFDNNSDSKLLELENVLKEKEDTINNLKETQSALQNQISDLNSEIDKLKRMAVNMQRALQDLEARKS